MTASAFEEEKQEALAAGADGFLRKPIEQEHLFAMLEQQLGLRFQRTAAQAPRVPGAAFDLQQALGQLSAAQRQALLESVQALDLRRSAIVLAGVATSLPQLTAHIAAMLEQHQYQPLCALLVQPAGEPQGEGA